MFKRKKGYFLLTMLVLTGLAGRIHLDTLSGKERRTLTREIKTTKIELIQSIEGLSLQQLNFKTGKDRPSIRTCVYRLVATEHSLWASAKHSLQQQIGPEHLKPVNDELLPSLVGKKILEGDPAGFKSMAEALKLHKSIQNEMQRYIHTSTQNVRAHIVPTAAGNLDAYQLMMLSTLYSREYLQQIQQIKQARNFPK